MEMSFFIPGRMKAKGRPKFGKFGVYTPAETRKFEAVVRSIASEKWKEKNIIERNVPLKLRLVFRIKKPISKPKKLLYVITRPDLDNYIKAITDALNGIIYYDDAQIVHIEAFKMYTPEKYYSGPEGVELTIRELEHNYE